MNPNIKLKISEILELRYEIKWARVYMRDASLKLEDIYESTPDYKSHPEYQKNIDYYKAAKARHGKSINKLSKNGITYKTVI